MSQTSFYGHGKLLITGEYLVLQGAEALAVPLRLGQHVQVKKMRGADLHWKSVRPDGSEWFKGVFSLLDFSAQEATDPEIAAGISKILTAITRQNPDFLADWKGQSVESRLEFNPEWGLGTSSTLIHAMAEWGEAEAFTLLEQTFGGSGYDLACATSNGPIIFQSTDDEIRITPVTLNWPFKENIHLVWSGRKQNSRDSVSAHSSSLKKASASLIQGVSTLTQQIEDAPDLITFIGLLSEHNQLIGNLLQQDPNPWVPSFPGIIKPLGAWGGDFFMAVSKEDPKEMKEWFINQGYTTIFSWKDLVLEG